MYVRARFVYRRCHSILHVGDGEASGAPLSLHAVLLCFHFLTQNRKTLNDNSISHLVCPTFAFGSLYRYCAGPQKAGGPHEIRFVSADFIYSACRITVDLSVCDFLSCLAFALLDIDLGDLRRGAGPLFCTSHV